MTIYWFDPETLNIKHETFNVANLMAFYVEMDEMHPDGWYESMEDCEAELEYYKEGM